MFRWTVRQRVRATVTVAVALLVTTLGAAPALAADGRIDHIQTGKGTVQVLYSLPAAGETTPDLSSLAVSLNGRPLEASATLASNAKGPTVRRTAILAIDVSNSMKRNGKFTEAKRAAEVFLSTAPKDVYVGIVTFAHDVVTAQEPTLDRAASKSVIDGLTLSLSTHLYDGIRGAVRAAGGAGSRSILVLSDGKDTTGQPLQAVTDTVKNAGVKVDVVALAQSPEDQALLQQIADSGNGSVINADQPAALSQVFANEAQTLAKQLLVTVRTTPDMAGKEGNLSVSIDAGGQQYDASAFVTLDRASAAPTALPTKLAPAPAQRVLVSRNVMLGGLVGLGIAVLLILVGVFGGFSKKQDSVEARIDAYTQKGRRNATKSTPVAAQGMAAQAVGIAEKALESNRGLEVVLGDRLEAAGMSLKPAEWLLLHAACAVGAATVGFLISSGGWVMTLVLLFAGAIVPWFYLGMKRASRLKAFNSQLAETLQLMAGSLQAGLSIAQSIDTVVREGAEPIAGEFRRALVETRLGVQIEDALESISGRMESADFKWTVMAIRIQREVGGNLAELLISVADTLREREYLRRQVKALSAEGRFSAYILLALPPAIMLYMSFTNRAYLSPLFSTPIGFVMLGIMLFLMGLGAFTMKKLVKVEV